MMTTRVLPVLRGVLARDGRLPRLRLAAGPGAGAAVDAADEAVLAAALRRAVPGDGGPVRLAGLGTVTAEFAAVSGRAAGRVALVTGAAQGVGRDIAADLARQGAWVALADVNAAGAAAAAAEINAEHGREAATGVRMDVTDPDSVDAGVVAVVEAHGGIDLLVANAGIVRAGGVASMPVMDFDLVTQVNYRGYFLCVRAVAPVMARQHRTCPAAWADIIQINSKSGLEGSARNAAYAGSKAGGLGLTRSFALELASDGIKVNAICPGNFLDGPLWSDPLNGLFVQYLRAGKVPGARTVEDVRRAYEAKVPMGRGCTAADVMPALYYLMEQKYETGQALPVTGGQVMVG